MEDSPILTSQEMRKQYFPSFSISQYQAQNDYHQLLYSKGLQLNSKVYPSIFHLKNELPYIGMAIRQQLIKDQVLIRIPEELILCSAKAIQQPELKQIYQHPFFINQLWQDRAIIVYSLFLLHKKDENNIWYQMIRLFPKQCDILCFWKESQLSLLKDQTIIKAAKLDLQSYNEQWSQFLSLQKQYPVLQHEQFNQQNYKNVFINLNNRSFGKNINYVSLVPMAQLFNHHCSKVHYAVQTAKKQNVMNKEEEGDDSSSIGSYDSNQYIQEGQYSYDEVKTTPYNWNAEDSYKLIKKQKNKVQTQTKRILLLIENQIDWQDFFILAVGNFIQKLKIIQKEYLVGRKAYYDALNQLSTVQRGLKRYKRQIIIYYKSKNKPYMKVKDKIIQQKIKQFVYPIYKKQYESLVIKTNKNDKTQCNNQIYFKYGNNSNRSLLLRYGFAIEGNKYQHVWISLNILQYLRQYPDVLEKVIEKKISLYRKFKIHHHILNIDLILFFRLQKLMFYNQEDIVNIFKITNIPKEIMIIQQILLFLQEKINKYQGDYNLNDKTISYHEYFINIYHLEKLRILKKQIYMMEKIIIILNKINSGVSKVQALQILSKSQNKIFLYYFQNILN